MLKIRKNPQTEIETEKRKKKRDKKRWTAPRFIETMEKLREWLDDYWGKGNEDRLVIEERKGEIVVIHYLIQQIGRNRDRKGVVGMVWGKIRKTRGKNQYQVDVGTNGGYYEYRDEKWQVYRLGEKKIEEERNKIYYTCDQSSPVATFEADNVAAMVEELEHQLKGNRIKVEKNRGYEYKYGGNYYIRVNDQPL